MADLPKRPLTDAELIALAALANVEAVLMAGENESRKLNGYSPAWSDGCGYMPAASRLNEELHRRGINC